MVKRILNWFITRSRTFYLNGLLLILCVVFMSLGVSLIYGDWITGADDPIGTVLVLLSIFCFLVVFIKFPKYFIEWRHETRAVRSEKYEKKKLEIRERALKELEERARFKAEEISILKKHGLYSENEPQLSQPQSVEAQLTGRDLESFYGYAGFGRRTWAFMLDILLIYMILGPILGPLFYVVNTKLINSLKHGNVSGFLITHYKVVFFLAFLNAISFLIGWVYFAVMESSGFQATVGKLAMRIKVTDEKGARLTFLRATVRHWAKWLSSVILCIGFLMAGFTKKKQAWHDIIASCLVVRSVR